MIYKGINNQRVEFKITNYQFPNNNDGDWDSNWLNIYIKVNAKFGNWQTIDPSLTTWDVMELINWFIILSENNIPERFHMDFLEPTLSFVLTNSPSDQVKSIRINLDLVSRPKYASNDKENYIDILVNNDELKRLASELQDDLSRYPGKKPNI